MLIKDKEFIQKLSLDGLSTTFVSLNLFSPSIFENFLYKIIVTNNASLIAI